MKSETRANYIARLRRHAQWLEENKSGEKYDYTEIDRPFWPFDEFIFDRLLSIEEKLGELSGRPADCALARSNPEREDVINLVTGISGNIQRDQKYIAKRTRNTAGLTICDPYFFQWGGPNKVFKTKTQYVDYIVSLVPHEVRSLTLFYLPGPEQTLFNRFKKVVHSRGVSVAYYETNEIHDRVIINDEGEGMLLGTSFKGIGNKIAFVLPLPSEDVVLFMQELDRIKTGRP